MENAGYIDFETAYVALAKNSVLTRSKIKEVLTEKVRSHQLMVTGKHSLTGKRKPVPQLRRLRITKDRKYPGPVAFPAKGYGTFYTELRFSEADIAALASELSGWRDVCSPMDQWLTVEGAVHFLAKKDGKHSFKEMQRQLKAAIRRGRFNPDGEYDPNTSCVFEGCGIRLRYQGGYGEPPYISLVSRDLCTTGEPIKDKLCKDNWDRMEIRRTALLAWLEEYERAGAGAGIMTKKKPPIDIPESLAEAPSIPPAMLEKTEPRGQQDMFDAWAKKPYWDCEGEAVALSLGKDPADINLENVSHKYGANSPLRAEFLERLDTVARYVETGQIRFRESPAEFLSFAEKVGMDCPEGLKQAVSNAPQLYNESSQEALDATTRAENTAVIIGRPVGTGDYHDKDIEIVEKALVWQAENGSNNFAKALRAVAGNDLAGIGGAPELTDASKIRRLRKVRADMKRPISQT